MALLATLWFFNIALTWIGEDGGSDNFTHYQIARYAFSYPELFLSHWGKPIFTILAAPFTLLGENGIRVMNVLLAVATFIELLIILQTLEVKTSWSVFFFLFFAPAYYYMVPTSMTEVLFGFWLTTGVLFWVRNKPVAAIVWISFLIWIRTEGFVVWPAFILPLILKKQWKPILYLPAGFLLISLLGWPFKESIWWFFTEMPYGDATDIYGKGSLWHYVKLQEEISGPVIGLAFFVALSILIARFIKTGIRDVDAKLLVLVVSAGSAIGYFVAHSVSWYTGAGGSLGLSRVMAGIIPLTALITCLGLDELCQWKQKALRYSGIAVVASVSFLSSFWWFNNAHILYPENQIMKVVRNATPMFKLKHFHGQKLYYTTPAFIHYMNVDPYDQAKSHQYFNMVETKFIQPGEVVIWDSHHSPNEGGLPLEQLMESDQFKLIDHYAPDEPFQVLSKDFELYFFEKTEPNAQRKNEDLLVKLDEQYELERPKINLFESDFHSLDSGYQLIDTVNPYSWGAKLKTGNISFTSRYYLEVEADLIIDNPECVPNVNFVMAQSLDSNMVGYDSEKLSAVKFKKSGTRYLAKAKLNPNYSAFESEMRCYLFVTEGCWCKVDKLAIRAVPRLLN